jgi:hypothetical protein
VNGAVAPGFPVTLPGDVYSSPAVGDLDDDGDPDIVVGYGSTIEGPSSMGGVRAFRRDGTLLWQRVAGDFVGPSDGIPDPVMSTPAIGDVDGDGLTDVAWGGLDAHIHLVRGTASTGGLATFVRDTSLSPALADLDGDGKPEIVIGADAHAEDPLTHPRRRLPPRCATTTRAPGFPKCVTS